MKQRGSVELRALLWASATWLVILGFLALRAWGGINIIADKVTVTNTPAKVGINEGRCLLDILNDEASGATISCGPWTQPSSVWWPLSAGRNHTWGIVDDGQCTAQQVIGCVSASATPATAWLSQEGHMPDITPTVTDTPTAGPTGTRTLTFTVTRTFTPTQTFTVTKTVTPTYSPTPTATATRTATPTAT